MLAVDLEACRAFAELHTTINATIRDIYEVGEPVVYDVAHRIGAFLKLEPKRVYLHRGTRDGAVAVGLGRDRKWIDLAELPEEFGGSHRRRPRTATASTNSG